jgi:predicted small metal-binding protein
LALRLSLSDVGAILDTVQVGHAAALGEGAMMLGTNMTEGPMTDAERLKLTCHCGWNTQGSRDEVITKTREHVMKVHWVEADDEDILEMATPA